MLKAVLTVAVVTVLAAPNFGCATHRALHYAVTVENGTNTQTVMTSLDKLTAATGITFDVTVTKFVGSSLPRMHAISVIDSTQQHVTVMCSDKKHKQVTEIYACTHNRTQNDSADVYLQPNADSRIILHELGHGIGLGHGPIGTAMYTDPLVPGQPNFFTPTDIDRYWSTRMRTTRYIYHLYPTLAVQSLPRTW